MDGQSAISPSLGEYTHIYMYLHRYIEMCTHKYINIYI